MDVSSLQQWLVKWLEDSPGKELGPLAVVFITTILLLWLGPKVIRFTSRHALLTPYQRNLQRKKHTQDLEKRQKTLNALFSNIWRIVVILSAVYAGFRIFGVADILAPLFASAGIIGVAIGFGAQTLVKDFLSGIFIISENQYRVGDVIEVDGFGGTVEQIGIRSTTLRDVDGNVHYFPNGLIQHVINKTMDYSMARFTLLISPDANVDHAIKVIDKIGLRLAEEEEWKAKIIEPPHYDMVSGFTATSVGLIVTGKTQPSDQWSVMAEMRKRLLVALEREGIDLGIDAVLPAHPRGKKKL